MLLVKLVEISHTLYKNDKSWLVDKVECNATNKFYEYVISYPCIRIYRKKTISLFIYYLLRL